MPAIPRGKDLTMKMTKKAIKEFEQRLKDSAKMGISSPVAVEGKELIILAMGPSRGQCPFDAETWALNTGYVQVKEMRGHFEKIFIVHRQVYLADGKPYFDFDYLQSLDSELIMTHRIKGVKAKLYPYKRIAKKFSTEFFSDTICYMIAYALDKSTKLDKNGRLVYTGGYNKLRLYGIDMQEQEEYGYEKGGIEFWLGIAKGLGIGYTVSMGSTLFTTFSGMPYGQIAKMKDMDSHRLLRRKRKLEPDETPGRRYRSMTVKKPPPIMTRY